MISYFLRRIPSYCLVIAVLLSQTTLRGTEIRQQEFDMRAPKAGEFREEALLEKEIPEVTSDHVALAGPISHSEQTADDHATILLFIEGNGTLRFNGNDYQIKTETIALPISKGAVKIDVPAGEVLHYVRILKDLSQEDFADIKNLTARADRDIYFTTFEACEPYHEAIKSPKTISRTVLPNQYIPRVAMGTVQTTGPDEVGAHRHPMLDQMFLGLAENDVVVTADETHARFKQYSLLHIPLGSLHGVKAEPSTKMYYMWMDFFLTKEGEEWLKTHKPVTE